MASQSYATRSRRPADPEEALVSRAVEATQWAKRNARWVIIGTVALFALVGGLLFYRIIRTQNAERASAEYLQVQQRVAANPQLAPAELQRFIQGNDGSALADEARLNLAAHYLEAGQPKQAIPVVQPLAKRPGSSSLAAQAGLLLGAAQAANGQRDAALKTYLGVADAAGARLQKQDALSSAALLREEAGDFAGAAEIYARLAADEEEGSLDRSVFEMRRAEAEARAAAK